MHTFKYWLPVALWMGIIFTMSSDFGSAAHTSRIIEPLVLWIKPNATGEEFELVHLLVRKCGHLSEYAILAILILRAIKRSRQQFYARLPWQAAGLALLVAAVYAATDEWHQSFVPGRTATFGDVLIDCCGALVGLTFMSLYGLLKSAGIPPFKRPVRQPATQTGA